MSRRSNPKSFAPGTVVRYTAKFMRSVGITGKLEGMVLGDYPLRNTVWVWWQDEDLPVGVQISNLQRAPSDKKISTELRNAWLAQGVELIPAALERLERGENPCFVSEVTGGVLVVTEHDDHWDGGYVTDEGEVYNVISTSDMTEAFEVTESWAASHGICPVGNPQWQENPLSRDARAALGGAMAAAVGGAWGAHAAGTAGAGLGAAVGGLVGSYGAAHFAEVTGAVKGASRGVREARSRELASKVEVAPKETNRRRRR